jgi:hypothetical protein
VYVLGGSVVSVWTLLRFFTQRTIFDLVSQQVVVHQWLHGTVSTAQMGQTAYVPKMLLLYAPLDVLPGSPRFKLIVVTLAINIATFVFIGLLLERLLRHYGVRIGWVFYTVLLWLSVLAGSMFWIEFANSRNLEVAGGVLLLLLGVRCLDQPSRRRAAGFAAFGGVLFFGDPLQVYMTGLPLMIYAGSLTVMRKIDRRRVAVLGGLLIAAWVVSQVLFAAAGSWLHLTFTGTGAVAAPHLSATWLEQSVIGTAKAAFSLLAGANDAGRLRELANLGLLALGTVAVIYTAVHRWLPRKLLLLTGCVCVADTVVYMASGQAGQGAATSRYLIMLMPVLALVFSAVRLPKAALKPAAATAGATLLLNVVALAGALGTHWNTAFPADEHVVSAYRYIRQHPGTHVYASVDTAMAALYLDNLPAGKALPVGCLSGRLVQTHYSMDQVFAASAVDARATAAIVFDATTINNTPSVCTPASVQAQFGAPAAVDRLDDGSVVLRYPQAAVQLAG